MSNTVEPDFQKELSKKELKIQHYRQKCAELQESNADLRVELTLVSQELEELRQNATLEAGTLAAEQSDSVS